MVGRSPPDLSSSIPMRYLTATIGRLLPSLQSERCPLPSRYSDLHSSMRFHDPLFAESVACQGDSWNFHYDSASSQWIRQRYDSKYVFGLSTTM